MMKSLRLKSLLLAFALASSGCNKFYWVPDEPDVGRCAYRIEKGAFYCVNTVSDKKEKISSTDYRMQNAQCLSNKDYKKYEQWKLETEKRAGDHCD